MRSALVLALLATACAGNVGPTTREVNNQEEVDEEPPVIEHEYDPSYRVTDIAVFLGATVTDDSLVDDVLIIYQRVGDGGKWTQLRMAPLTDDYYEGVIPGNDVYSSGIRYYVKAIDEWGNEACLPEACSEEAWFFPVGPERN